jgi:hypothetical protein
LRPLKKVADQKITTMEVIQIFIHHQANENVAGALSFGLLRTAG